MKRLFVLFLLLVLFCSLVSCADPAFSGNIADCAEAVDSKYVDFEIIESDSSEGWVILYDKNTMVMYIILDGYQSTGITPILNTDGTPKLYKGE